MSETPTDGPLGDLRARLQEALMLELSTIPPYATASYSIRQEGQYDRSAPQIVNAEPVEVIRQVMVEEMLHMVLAANVLNAVGGRPVMTDPAQVPRYPLAILGGKGPTLRLRRFTPEQVRLFREVERAPEPENIPRAKEGDYRTIGGFYIYVKSLLERACDELGEGAVFTGDPARQVGPEDYYGAGGHVIEVRDRATALEALTEIMEEGEGAHLGETAGDGDAVPGPEGEDREDIAHFFKFDEILHSRYYHAADRLGSPPTGPDLAVDWAAVWPMVDDPGGERFADPQVRALSDGFNALYAELLTGLEAAFNGERERLRALVPLMLRMKDAAQKLMRVPLDAPDGETAGPTWEFRGPAAS